MRTFKYDKQTDKYILEVEDKKELKEGKKVVGYQESYLKQVWDKDQINNIKSQMLNQKAQAEDTILKLDLQIKEIGITNREKQKLKSFYQTMIKAQSLQKLEQLEKSKLSVKQSLNKINQDIKELNEV